MFNFFKKKKITTKQQSSFEIELTAAVLAYEIARSDGEISKDELLVLMEEIESISAKVGKDKFEILKIIEIYSKDSISFHEFIEDINNYYSKEEKLSLLEYMWKISYADGKLDVDEERLVRRVANLIRIKDVEVLKLKDLSKINRTQ
tara:strand:+ start:525 stop:965 length:441 start_codon:yes stop_codon:yes gene_type:complete